MLEDRDEIAQAYVLGHLNADARAQVDEALARGDADWHSAVAVWRMRLDADAGLPEASPGVLSHIKREMWSENRLPWAKRIRLWEFALGGIASALFAYALLYWG